MAKSVQVTGSLKNSSVNLSRYMRHKMGRTPEEIAAEDKVTVGTVQNSIASIDAFRATHTTEFLNEMMVDVLMETRGNIKKALTNGLTASKKEGKKKVPDHLIQQKAVENAIRLTETLQPKPTKGISVNVKQQTAVAHAAPLPESGFTDYESRLRRLRNKIDQHNQLPSQTGTVIDDDADLIEESEGVEVTADAGSGTDTES